jgi:proton-coupled amino acid transporter
MSSPLPVNATKDSRSGEGDNTSSYINESVLAGSFDRAESIARLSSSPMPHPTFNFGTSPSGSTHSHLTYGSTTHHGDRLSVVRPHSPYGDNHSVDLPDEEIAKAVKRHLVSTSPSPGGHRSPSSHHRRSVNSTRHRDDSDDEEEEIADVHQLPGGAITHDIYKWTEAVEQDKKARMKRSQSVMVSRHEPSDPALVNLKDPGGFRRHYVFDRAAKKGRKPPSWITHTFVDFLAMYGHFMGEDLSDDEGMDSEDEEERRQRWSEIVGDGEGSDERTALLRQAQENSVEGTASPSKSVFLLLKSFIGTGKEKIEKKKKKKKLFSLVLILYFLLYQIMQVSCFYPKRKCTQRSTIKEFWIILPLYFYF